MLKIKNLRGECQHCCGPIEFHAESIGTLAECPHCGQETELMLAIPSVPQSPARTKAIVFMVIAILILVAGLVASAIALKRARRFRATQELIASPEATALAEQTGPFAAQEFRTTPVMLEKEPGSALVYAVGTIQNMSDHSRFGVKVELDLFDETGNKLGSASDYQKILEPGAEWKFRALVIGKQVASARLRKIVEAK